MLTLPLTIYQGYLREHQYEMATQTFRPWFIDQLKALGALTIGFALGIAVLYLVIRRTDQRWWTWGTGATVAMMAVAVMIAPVDDIYEFDASQQTTRVSANVSGIFGTAQVRLNDNLMHTLLPEIRSVMGHELGRHRIHDAMQWRQAMGTP